MVSIASKNVLIHSLPFAKAAATGKALNIILDAAKAMAMTAADLMASPDTLRSVKEEFYKGN